MLVMFNLFSQSSTAWTPLLNLLVTRARGTGSAICSALDALPR